MRNLGVDTSEKVKIATLAKKGASVLLGHKNLTLLEYDLQDMAETAFEILENLIEGRKPQHPHTYIKLMVRMPP